MTNAIKVLLQMTSVSLQPVPTLGTVAAVENSDTLTTPNFKLCKWY
jgi:hypothetical protein